MLNKIILSGIVIVSSSISFANEYYISDINERSDKRFTQDYKTQNITKKNDIIIKPYVINGTDATINDFPFYARLTIPVNDTSFFHTCGGSILSSKYILTAAHCVDNVNISEYAIVINHDNNNFSFSDFRKISEVYLHPDYNTIENGNDIAILELEEEIKESFTAISIASPNEVRYYDNLEDLTVIGMGQINTNNDDAVTADTLQRGDVSLLTDEDCETFSGGAVSEHDKTICAAPKKGVDSCYGDSGGPITYMGNDGYRQAGLVSFGLGLTDVCAADNSLTVYTEISGHADWITEVTGIERDINGVNDTDNPKFVNPSKKSGGSIGIFSGILLFSLALYRRKKF